MNDRYDTLAGIIDHPKIKERLKGIKKTPVGIKSFVPLVKVASLRLGELSELASKTVYGTTQVVDVITDEKKVPNLSEEERFDAIFTILAHRAYGKGLLNVL